MTRPLPARPLPSSTPARHDCADNRLTLTRRGLMGLSVGLFSSTFLSERARANTLSDARLLIVVLRGGMDGLSLLVPAFDPAYYTARGPLAVPPEQALALSGGFLLHPAMREVHALYAAGETAFVPSAGLPLQTRSHFECQEVLENGLAGSRPGASGWVNRLLSVLPRGEPLRDGRMLAINSNPLIVRGSEPVLNWSSTWFPRLRSSAVAPLHQIYAARDPELLAMHRLGLEVDAMAGTDGLQNDPDLPPVVNGFRGAARLLMTAGGPRVAVLAIDGWDTHAEQGVLDGQFAERLSVLDRALGVLRRDLAGVWDSTAVVVTTEFGRTVPANGTRGTDHGIGMPVLLAGGAVRGGIHGDWPGCAPGALLDGYDLRPTLDLRSVFKGVLSGHLGVDPAQLDTVVFPDSARAAPLLQGLIVETTSRRPRAASDPAPLTEAQLSVPTPILAYRQRHGAFVP
ncbi:MAG: DUF1501 domain-containing protein [Proteobacteria bacterium]|nr:DUF1501 domain-containing protein [Pseudomonadota bacterium]